MGILRRKPKIEPEPPPEISLVQAAVARVSQLADDLRLVAQEAQREEYRARKANGHG